MSVAIPEPSRHVRELFPSAASTAATDLVRWAEAAEAAHGMAQALVRTQFVPEVYRGKPAEATAAILLGAEVGLSPLAALRSVYMVKGTPAMYARTLHALVTSRGHQVWTVSERDDAVTVAGKRKGSDHVEEVTWTLARATAAGFAKANPNYRTNPRAMLWARAVGDVARRIAPDVLLGIPEASVEDLGGAVDEATTPTASPSTGTVRRRATARTEATPPSQRFVSGEPLDGDESPAAVPSPAPLDEADEADEAPPEDDGGEVPEPKMTPAQRARLHAEFNAAGMDRDGYLGWTRQALDRPELSTTRDLTVTEASFLLDRIAEAKALKADHRGLPPDPTADRHP